MEEFIAEIDISLLVLIGAILPMIQSVIQAASWPGPVKKLIGFLGALVVGAGAGWLMGLETREGYIAMMAATYGIQEGLYQGVLKPTGLSRRIETTVLKRGITGTGNGSESGHADPSFAVGSSVVAVALFCLLMLAASR